uniref:Ig-like domain-containing protein n=1 Tax=Accipiter nisus TaxID=211598 RepID=A0A8B9MTJ4_9AVES
MQPEAVQLRLQRGRSCNSLFLLWRCSVIANALVCLVSHFSPAPVAVEWLVDDERLVPAPSVDPVVPDAAGGTFSTSSHLNVSLEEWQQKTFTCKVTHPGSSSVQEVTGQKCLSESRRRRVGWWHLLGLSRP